MLGRGKLPMVVGFGGCLELPLCGVLASSATLWWLSISRGIGWIGGWWAVLASSPGAASAESPVTLSLSASTPSNAPPVLDLDESLE